MNSNHAPKTTDVFNNLIASLGEIRDDYVNSPERFSNPLDVTEGYRYVGQLLSIVVEDLADQAPGLMEIITPLELGL